MIVIIPADDNFHSMSDEKLKYLKVEYQVDCLFFIPCGTVQFFLL